MQISSKNFNYCRKKRHHIGCSWERTRWAAFTHLRCSCRSSPLQEIRRLEICLVLTIPSETAFVAVLRHCVSGLTEILGPKKSLVACPIRNGRSKWLKYWPTIGLLEERAIPLHFESDRFALLLKKLGPWLLLQGDRMWVILIGWWRCELSFYQRCKISYVFLHFWLYMWWPGLDDRRGCRPR